MNIPRWRWPNIHEWALVGFFGLTWETLRMVRENPALLGVPSFMQFASQLVGGGLLLAAAWLYSAGKRAAEDRLHPLVPTDAKGAAADVADAAQAEADAIAAAPGSDEVKP